MYSATAAIFKREQDTQDKKIDSSIACGIRKKEFKIKVILKLPHFEQKKIIYLDFDSIQHIFFR